MRLLAAGALLIAVGFSAAHARTPPEKIALLNGDQYTCNGAERAGTPGGVAPYSGQWLGAWPGLKKLEGYTPGPYADEKPLYTVTADNLKQYEARLTDGQKALLRKYPKSFRMKVYPSHRDFRWPDWACDVVKKNAAEAEITANGLGTTGTSGAISFPFPQNGLEAIWNVNQTLHVWNETATFDVANVYANGSIAWGKQELITLGPASDPARRGSNQDKIAAYFYNKTLLPERDKGTIAVGYQPNDFSKGSTQVWAYNTGTRRMRQAPDIAFDYPTPPSGLRTVDDDHLFNGSPERYDWKLLGKRELLIPYNNFAINDPALKLTDLLTPHTPNPDYVRYELHRVWVIEATLKDGLRHVYGKRMLYVDEDTWLAMWADNYDLRKQLWRTAFVAFRYAPDAQAYHRGVSVYHDLTADAYEAGYLVNQSGSKWWKLNRKDLKPSMFSPENAARSGH